MQGRRRLQQGTAKLVQPGVQLSVQIPTTQGLAQSIQSALSSAVDSNQLVNAYKSQNSEWGSRSLPSPLRQWLSL